MRPLPTALALFPMRRVLFLVVVALAATRAANVRGRSADPRLFTNGGAPWLAPEKVVADDGDDEEDHQVFSKVISSAKKAEGDAEGGGDDIALPTVEEVAEEEAVEENVVPKAAAKPAPARKAVSSSPAQQKEDGGDEIDGETEEMEENGDLEETPTVATAAAVAALLRWRPDRLTRPATAKVQVAAKEELGEVAERAAARAKAAASSPPSPPELACALAKPDAATGSRAWQCLDKDATFRQSYDAIVDRLSKVSQHLGTCLGGSGLVVGVVTGTVVRAFLSLFPRPANGVHVWSLGYCCCFP